MFLAMHITNQKLSFEEHEKLKKINLVLIVVGGG